MRVAIILTGLLLSTSASAEVSKIHSDAPPETQQFAFLLGAWDCKTENPMPDGTVQTGEATWSGELILDGWAIQDYWISKGPNGQTFHGTNIRSFNPQTKKWDNRWLPSGSLQWKYYAAEKVGDTMVMTGGEGEDRFGKFIDRNTFSDFKKTSWLWQKDRSYDGGKTWIENVARIHCSRHGAAKKAD